MALFDIQHLSFSYPGCERKALSDVSLTVEPGELLLLDFDHRIAFTGDVYVNIHGMTEAQSTYNRYAPILMTSVDTDPQLCAAERQAFFALLTPGTWRIFGAHGACKTMTV